MPKSLEHSLIGPLTHCLLLPFMNATLHRRVKLNDTPLSQNGCPYSRIFVFQNDCPIICLARKRGSKSNVFATKPSISRSLSTLQLPGAFLSSCFFFVFLRVILTTIRSMAARA